MCQRWLVTNRDFPARRFALSTIGKAEDVRHGPGVVEIIFAAGSEGRWNRGLRRPKTFSSPSPTTRHTASAPGRD